MEGGRQQRERAPQELDPSPSDVHHGKCSPCKGVRLYSYASESQILSSLSLTVGSAVGSIRELFTKVKAIDAKHGKFDLLLCTGDFFGPVAESTPDDEVSQLLAGQLEGASSLPVAFSCTYSYASANRMLPHAGGPTVARKSCEEVRRNWRRALQRGVSNESVAQVHGCPISTHSFQASRALSPRRAVFGSLAWEAYMTRISTPRQKYLLYEITFLHAGG